MRYFLYLVDWFRYFIRSPWAPYRVASALMDLGAVLLAAVAVWLCFGGPVGHAYWWALHALAVAQTAAH